MKGTDKKISFTVYIPRAVVEKYRDAAYWTPGATVTDLVFDSLINGIEKLEKKNGGPFEPRSKPLKRGRRLKA